jgi:hypothetical protein
MTPTRQITRRTSSEGNPAHRPKIAVRTRAASVGSKAASGKVEETGKEIKLLESNAAGTQKTHDIPKARTKNTRSE